MLHTYFFQISYRMPMGVRCEYNDETKEATYALRVRGSYDLAFDLKKHKYEDAKWTLNQMNVNGVFFALLADYLRGKDTPFSGVDIKRDKVNSAETLEAVLYSIMESVLP